VIRLQSIRLATCEHCSKFRWRVYWLYDSEFGACDTWCKRCRPDLLAEYGPVAK